HRRHVLAEPHDRALAEAALDLRERRIKGLRFVHGRSFDETKRCTHVPCSLWPGFDKPTTDAANPLACPFLAMAMVGSVHGLFWVGNMRIYPFTAFKGCGRGRCGLPMETTQWFTT